MVKSSRTPVLVSNTQRIYTVWLKYRLVVSPTLLIILMPITIQMEMVAPIPPIPHTLVFHQYQNPCNMYNILSIVSTFRDIKCPPDSGRQNRQKKDLLLEPPPQLLWETRIPTGDQERNYARISGMSQNDKKYSKC